MSHIESLFRTEASYDPAYNTFLDCFPCSAYINERDVRRWLRSWFGVSDMFDSDMGLDVYMRRIKLTGRWIQKMRKRDLIWYLAKCNRYAEELAPCKCTQVEEYIMC